MGFFGKYYNEPITVLFYVFKYVIISGSNWVSFTGLLLCKSPGKKGFFYFFLFFTQTSASNKNKENDGFSVYLNGKARMHIFTRF